MSDAARIRTLPADVVNRIAAGEVVERPASVVKELVENALDAGARRVQVEVEEGGRRLIRVSDDGHGVSALDMERLFTAHSTSKLSDVDDLLHIGTFGFRGEALASIGAVSRATVRSRVRGEASGHQVACEFGAVSPPRPAASPEGTAVEVRDLFRNVPARLKFLKSPAAEMARVTEVVSRFGISVPDAEFVLVHEGRPVLRFPAGMGRRDRIALAFGRNLKDALLTAEGQGAGVSVECDLAPPAVTRADTTGLLFFLNGRFVRDKALLHAVRQAYADLIFGPRHPVAFVYLSMDPALVDQNVHPAKVEVRFRDSSSVHALVSRTVREALTRADLARPVALAPGTVPEVDGADRERRVREAVADFLARRPRTDPPAGGGLFPSGLAGGGRPAAGGPAGRAVDFLQVRNTYIVLETDRGIEILDQHALHERVLYDRLRARAQAAGPVVQRLLRPVVVELAAPEVEAVLASKEALAAVGVLVEAFGRGAVAVGGIPAALVAADPAEVLLGLLPSLSEEGGPSGEALRARLLSTMACKAAVKAGDPLTREQVADLLRCAEELAHAHTCPHGRPTALRIDYAALERHFERK